MCGTMVSFMLCGTAAGLQPDCKGLRHVDFCSVFSIFIFRKRRTGSESVRGYQGTVGCLWEAGYRSRPGESTSTGGSAAYWRNTGVVTFEGENNDEDAY